MNDSLITWTCICNSVGWNWSQLVFCKDTHWYTFGWILFHAANEILKLLNLMFVSATNEWSCLASPLGPLVLFDTKIEDDDDDGAMGWSFVRLGPRERGSPYVPGACMLPSWCRKTTSTQKIVDRLMFYAHHNGTHRKESRCGRADILAEAFCLIRCPSHLEMCLRSTRTVA